MLASQLIHVISGAGSLEAAIGIEPMNKGFAVSPGTFSDLFAVLNHAFFLDLLGYDIFAVVPHWPDFWAVGTHLAHKKKIRLH